MPQFPDETGAGKPAEPSDVHSSGKDVDPDEFDDEEPDDNSTGWGSGSSSHSGRITLGERYRAWKNRTIEPRLRKFARRMRRIRRHRDARIPLSRRIGQSIALCHKALVRSFRNLRKSGIAGIKIPAVAAYPLVFVVGACLATAVTVFVTRQRRASSEVIVAVAGSVVRAPDFYHRMELEVGPQLMNRLVDEELVLQFASQKGLLPNAKAVQDRAKLLKQQPIYQNNTAKSHILDLDVERQARVQLATEALYSQGVPAVEADAREYYRTQSDPRNPGARFYIPETAQLFEIATITEPLALKAYHELRQGQVFDAVERRYNQDRSAGEGGKMLPVRRGRTPFALEPALENAIFKLQPGEVLSPRKFRGTWRIIKLGSVEPARVIPYDVVKKDCLTQAQLIMAARQNTTRLQSEFLEYRKKAKVQVFWTQYYYDLIGRQADGGLR